MDYRLEIRIPTDKDFGMGAGVIGVKMVRHIGLPPGAQNKKEFLDFVLDEAAKWRDQACTIVVIPMTDEDENGVNA